MFRSALLALQQMILNLVSSELQGHERTARAAVEALEEKLHSRQEVQEVQQPIRALEQRLADMSAKIVALRDETKSLESEHQKALVTSDDELSRKNNAKDRKW